MSTCQIERNAGAFGYGVSKEDRASLAKPIYQNWQSLFNVARQLNKTPYNNCGKMTRRIRDLKTKALKVVSMYQINMVKLWGRRH